MKRKIHPLAFALGTLALFGLGQALFLGNSGCSSGAICYRVTDCPIGDRCVSGTCTHRIEVSDDGTTASSGTSAGGSANTPAATAGTGGPGTMTGALTNASDAEGADARTAVVSEAGTSGG